MAPFGCVRTLHGAMRGMKAGDGVLFLAFMFGFTDLFVIFWVGKDFAVHPTQSKAVAPDASSYLFKEVVLGFNHTRPAFWGSRACFCLRAIPEKTNICTATELAADVGKLSFVNHAT